VDFLRRFYETAYADEDKVFKPAGGIGRKLKYWLFSRWIRRYFPKDEVIRTLEIGCGQGDFLKTVKNDPRFDAQGIDFAEAPLKYAASLGLNVEKGDLRSQDFTPNSFDLIISLHVFEHVHDVNAIIEDVSRLLKPNGMLFLVCPCVSHVKAAIAGKSWKYIGPPGHLWYFSTKTLSGFLEKSQFDIVHASCFYHRAHVRILARKHS